MGVQGTLQIIPLLPIPLLLAGSSFSSFYRTTICKFLRGLQAGLDGCLRPVFLLFLLCALGSNSCKGRILDLLEWASLCSIISLMDRMQFYWWRAGVTTEIYCFLWEEERREGVSEVQMESLVEVREGEWNLLEAIIKTDRNYKVQLLLHHLNYLRECRLSRSAKGGQRKDHLGLQVLLLLLLWIGPYFFQQASFYLVYFSLFFKYQFSSLSFSSFSRQFHMSLMIRAISVTLAYGLSFLTQLNTSCRQRKKAVSAFLGGQGGFLALGLVVGLATLDIWPNGGQVYIQNEKLTIQ